MKLAILLLFCLITYSSLSQGSNKKSILLSYYWYIENQSRDSFFSFDKDIISLKTDGLLEKGLDPDFNSRRYDYWQLSFDPGFNERNAQQLLISKIEVSSKINDTLVNDNYFTYNGSEYCTVYFDSPYLIKWNMNKNLLSIKYNGILYSYRISRFRKNEIKLIQQP